MLVRRAEPGAKGRDRGADHRVAAAYAIKAVRAAEDDDAGRRECAWRRDQLPDAVRDLVLDDQRARDDLCWSVFEP